MIVPSSCTELLRDTLAYLRRTKNHAGGYIAAVRKPQPDGTTHLEGCEQDRFLLAERIEKALAQDPK